LPTRSDAPTVQMASIASGSDQVPPEDLFADGNVPACQTTGIAGKLSNLRSNLLYRRSRILTLRTMSLH